MFRNVKKGKIGYSSAPLSLLYSASRINILGDPCKKLQPNLWVSHIQKSAWDSLHQRSKKGVTLLFGVRSGWMTNRWKDNLKHFAIELWFSTYSILEVEEKLVEDEPVVRDNMEGGEDGMRNNWDQGSWKRANIEGWTKATMGWWYPRMPVDFKIF
jgi:hypothetical protein